MDITLNIAAPAEKPNKTKQKFSVGSEAISNRQTVNPSFVFTWDKEKGGGQPAVARKRATNTLKQYHATKIQSIQSKSSSDKPVTDVSNKTVQPVPKFNKTQSKSRETLSDSRQNESNTYSEVSLGNVVSDTPISKPTAKLKESSNKNKQEHNSEPAKVYFNHSLFNEKPKSTYVRAHKGVSVYEKVFANSGNSFEDLNISKHLKSNLIKNDLKTLTTVQEKAIPVVLSGRNTLIRSQTGSGKTLTYAVPIIDALQSITPRLRRVDGVQAIIVVPTRELALQTRELFSKINTFQWVVTGHLCGGENRKSEKERLRKGINVLIGTPGRLLDHVLHTASFKINKVRCLVLDEADRLLDMGFRKDIISLVEALDKNIDTDYDPMALLKKSTQGKHKKFSDDYEEDKDSEEETNQAPPKSEEMEETSPLRNIHSKKRQTILLSATLNKGVSELAEFTMKEHVFVDALDDLKSISGEHDMNCMIIPSSVKQEFIVTFVKHRLFTLSALLIAKAKENSKTFVFMASSQMVEFHHELFTKGLVKLPKKRGKAKVGNVALLDDDEYDENDSSDEEEIVLDVQFFKLHGSMDQKQRKEVFQGFRSAKCGILICTDVAARGLDVPAAECIIQYTGPQTDEDYLHRVGRTGRAGRKGSAIIFLTHEEQEYVTRLQEHRVFLKERKPDIFLKHLCEIMDEPTVERAAEALQRRYESCIQRDKALYKSACFAYSTWSRFYNSYPAKMRTIFDFKKANLGHYVTSFALRETPSAVARVVRGQVAEIETPRLNKKLANHKEDANPKQIGKGAKGQKRPLKMNRAKSLIVSEYASGLVPAKKKKKKN